ncbi:MAG: hypothetical protein IPL65_19645 [Lewinellaceae bacterium]|nr:hypothetical protein [Lewinellaceae bacterium]
MMLPVDPAGKVIPGGEKVAAAFEVQAASKLSNFILAASFNHDFTTPESQGVIFTAQEMVLDFSDEQNAAGFDQAFPGKAGTDWAGLYIKTLGVKLPKGFSKKGQAVSFNASNLCADKLGVSGKFTVNNLLKVNEGSTAGWRFSINTFSLELLNSAIKSGSMAGEIVLPVNETTGLSYSAAIHGGNQGAGFEFVVNTEDEVEASMWLAQFKLFPGSSIVLTKDGDSKFKATAVLNGEVSILFGGDNPKPAPKTSGVSQVSIPKLKFQELSIQGRDLPGYIPELDFSFIELQNQATKQISLGGFEFQLNSLNFKKKGNGKEIGLGIDLTLALFGGDQDKPNAIGGQTAFTIWADYNIPDKRFAFKAAEIDAISIDVDLGAAALKGGIAIYKEDAVFGNGFRGELEATVKGVGVKIAAAAQFGRTLPNKGNFKYWYFDIMAEWGGPGINIPGTAASLYGFGGGAWYNMSWQDNLGVASVGKYQTAANYDLAKAGSSKTGNVFTPKADVVGFKASVVFGITGSKEAFNGDVTFSMELDKKDLSVNNLRLQGNAYVMQNIDDRSSGFVHCVADIKILPPQKVFHGNFGVDINLMSMIKGSGTLDIYFKGKENPGDQGTWHIKAGYWTQEYADDPFNDPNRINLGVSLQVGDVLKAGVKFQTYFMTGNDLPDGLPPLPAYIRNIVNANDDYDYNAPVKPATPAALSNTNQLGIAIGAGYQLQAGLKFLFLYADLTAEAAFDITLYNYGNVSCSGQQGDAIGFNGWYAQGQAFAYLHGDAGLFVDIDWLNLHGKVSLIDLTTGAVLEAKLPNPYWFRGRFGIEGEALGGLVKLKRRNFDFEIGEQCQVALEVNPFNKLDIIAEIKPANNAKKVSVFTDPQVSFNLADGMQNMFSVEIPGDPAVTKWFYAQHTVKLSYVANNQVKEVPVELKWNADRTAVRMVPKDILLEKTEYTLYVEATGFELGAGKIISQIRSVKFTTGPRPDHLVVDNMKSTYPYPNQRFFMKDKFNGGAADGAIKLFKNQCYLFNGISQSQLAGDQMVARFTELKTGKDIDVPCKCNDAAARIEFSIPPALKNEEIYALSIVRKIGKSLTAATVPTTEDKYLDNLGNELSAGNGMAQQALNLGINNNPKQSTGLYSLQKKLTGGDASSEKKYENVLFSKLYFRTSKYNNMQQKMNTYSVKKVAYYKSQVKYEYNINGNLYGNSDGYNNPVVLLQGGENFDQYDLYGYTVGFNGETHEEESILFPLGEMSNTWLGTVKSKYYEFTSVPVGAMRSFLTANRPPSYVQRPAGFPYYGDFDMLFNSKYRVAFLRNFVQYEQAMHSDGSLGAGESLLRPAAPLSASEINAAKAQGGGNIGQFTLNQGGGNNGMGLNLNLNGNTQAYFPILDLQNAVAHSDKYRTDTHILGKALGVSVPQFVQTYHTLKGLGWPAMPKRNFPMTMNIREYRHINGSQIGELKNWSYYINRE